MDGIRWFKTIINIDEDVGPQYWVLESVYCAGRLCLRKKSFVEVTGRERSALVILLRQENEIWSSLNILSRNHVIDCLDHLHDIVSRVSLTCSTLSSSLLD
ncbi:hypothetical protein BDE02_08G174600 [Populus trichocarpa]|nr:hypothetical protein BDE02_08G174600 [Populus trichocarpa]